MDINVNISISTNDGDVKVRTSVPSDENEPKIVRAADRDTAAPDGANAAVPDDDTTTDPAETEKPNKGNAHECVPGQEVRTELMAAYEEVISALLAMLDAGDSTEFINVTGMSADVEARVRRYLNAKAQLPKAVQDRLFTKE